MFTEEVLDPSGEVSSIAQCGEQESDLLSWRYKSQGCLAFTWLWSNPCVVLDSVVYQYELLPVWLSLTCHLPAVWPLCSPRSCVRGRWLPAGQTRMEWGPLPQPAQPSRVLLWCELSGPNPAPHSPTCLNLPGYKKWIQGNRGSSKPRRERDKIDLSLLLKELLIYLSI